MKRFLSIFLALVMLLSMVTFAHADEPVVQTATEVDVKYINANTSTIVIELDSQIPEATLAEAITLTKNDVPVEGDIAVVYEGTTATPPHAAHSFFEDTAKSQYMSVRALTASTNHLYSITPAARLDFGAEYVLTIDSSALGYQYIATIVVNKIYNEEFNYASRDDSPWFSGSTPAHTIADGVMTVTKNKVAYLRQNSSNTNREKVFADTTNTALNYADNTPDQPRINIEADVALDDVASQHRVGIGMGTKLVTDTFGKDNTPSYVAFLVGASAVSAEDDGDKFNSFILGKRTTTADPLYSNYAGSSAISTYMTYGVATNVPAAGGTPARAFTGVENMGYHIEGTKTAFKANETTKLYMYLDQVSNKVVYGGAGDYYDYSFEALDVALDGAPVIINESATATVTVDNLIASYPTITVEIIKDYNFEGPVHWNAASDSITLDFDMELSADELMDNLVVEDANGDIVDITKVTKLTDVTPETNATDKYSYRVDLNKRFVDDAVYTLTMLAGRYTDAAGNGAVLARDYVLNFKVDLFVVEEFKYEKGSYANSSGTANSNLPWTVGALSTGKYGNATILEDTDKNTYAQVITGLSDGSTSGRTWLAPANDENAPDFANTLMGGYAYSTSSAENALRKTSDYTMEVDVKVTAPSTKYQFKIQGTDKRHTTGSNYSYFTIAKASDGKITVTTDVAKEGTKYISAHKTDSVAFPALSENDLASSSYVRVAMSIKGKDHKWNIGDALIHEITTGETAQANAIPVFDLDTSSIKGNTYCIDNLILSKATEVEIAATTTVEDITVKVGEEVLETLEDVTGPVDVIVTLNRTGSAAPLKAVLAVYGVANNGAETMTNVYENETATSLTVGENVITFEDVDLNSGNTINVFFWDDFANLFPYTAPVVFPEPVVAE